MYQATARNEPFPKKIIPGSICNCRKAHNQIEYINEKAKYYHFSANHFF